MTAAQNTAEDSLTGRLRAIMAVEQGKRDLVAEERSGLAVSLAEARRVVTSMELRSAELALAQQIADERVAAVQATVKAAEDYMNGGSSTPSSGEAGRTPQTSGSGEQPETIRELVLKELQGGEPRTLAELLAAVRRSRPNTDRRSVSGALTPLHTSGLVQKLGRGLYQLAEKGDAQATTGQ